jgi:hypothetical protein
MDKEILDKIKKEEIYPILDDYYKSIGRTHPPPFRHYSLSELKKCLVMFKISLLREKI